MPHAEKKTSIERGQNLASAALQRDWIWDAEEQKLNQLTAPAHALDFIYSWAGLYDAARKSPDILAEYLPQLTIPGFGSGFEDVFDALLMQDAPPFYETHTIDGLKPLCRKEIAWRQASFGNYAARRMAESFSGRSGSYKKQRIPPFNCAVWLLSEHSNWMPARIKAQLLSGFAGRSLWFDRYDISQSRNAFSERMFGPRSKFKATRAVKDALVAVVKNALDGMSLDSDATLIASRFLEADFVQRHYDWQDQINAARRK